jgi:hypothetical protein
MNAGAVKLSPMFLISKLKLLFCIHQNAKNKFKNIIKIDVIFFWNISARVM